MNDSLNTEISDFYLVMDGQPIPTKVIKTIQTDENGMSELKISYLNLVTGGVDSFRKLVRLKELI